MASISAIRSGISANLLAAGIRSAATIPDLINPPFAIIAPSGVSYHRAFNNALTEYTFTITLIVGRASERSAQNLLDGYSSATGSTSIRVAVESDKTLGGVAYDTVVTEARNYGSIVLGETTYLAVEFNVAVQAD